MRDRLARVSLDLASEIAAWPVGSASVAVVNADGIIDVHDDGRRQKWASVTKIATALTILDACQEGVVSLDDEVGPPGSTLAHLLAHASGMGPDEREAMSPLEKRRIYSNAGYETAADHLAQATGRPFTEELNDRLLELLDMTDTRLEGSPAHGMVGTIGDLAAMARELLAPNLVLDKVVELASTLAYPGLDGVLPGYGQQSPNDWGLGCEIRDHKSPHWTAPENSPATFGHFGQAGSFCWVDRAAGLACVSLSDTPFGQWAIDAWPPLSSKVLAAYR